MKIAHRLLIYALGLITVLVAAVVVIIDQRLQSRVIEQTIDGLVREAKLVAVQWTGVTDTDGVADMAGAALRHRVTLIDEDGIVVGDSEFDGEALRALQNHGDRPEVALARRMPFGSARRVSSSAGDEEFYVAVRAPLGVARVSLPTNALDAVFERTRRDVLLAGLIALALAGVLAWLFSRSVSRPIVELRDVARQIADGDLTRRPALSAPGEIGDLATALYRLAEQLGARMAALQSDRTLLAAIIGSLEEGVIAVDSEGLVVQANEAAGRLLGVTAPIPFSVDMLPRDALLRDVLSDALRGAASGTVEIGIGGRTLLLTGRPLEHGGAVLALFDISTMRRLETVRRDFVANVSHELRTPLTVIAGFTETLAQDGVPADKRREFSALILGNATRMQRIVDDLLDLSRIESGGWIPNPTTVDVEEVIAEALSTLETKAEAKELELRSQVDARARIAKLDRTAVSQILTNLLENAIRHTARGTITVTASAAPGALELTVTDTGAGIPPDHLPRIFERFYRADSGRDRGSGGTGLGLAIVRHLVEAHGGRIEARSTVGTGTTITMFFPTHTQPHFPNLR